MSARRDRNGPVLILAGGTGGHIFPGLSVAAELQSRGVPVAWLGAEGAMETRLVPQHGIAIDAIAVKGLRGKGIATLLGAPLRVLSAVRAASRVLDRRRPRAVVSFGGYAAGPGGLAARLHGVPLVVHEQNRAPGMTNRVLARFARRVLTGFPQTFGGVREELAGNPVRSEIAALPPPAQRFAARDGGPMRLLVLGGSQGARQLNDAMIAALPDLDPARLEVFHQTGAADRARVAEAYSRAGLRAEVVDFDAALASRYQWADVALCRAGALTVAELAMAGLPALLVPYPHAADDHQRANARALEDAGAGRLLDPAGFDGKVLAGALGALLEQPEVLLEMGRRARGLARPDAARRIVDACRALVAGGAP